MQKNSITTIIGFFIKFPRRIPVLLDKLFLRFSEYGNHLVDFEWISNNIIDFEKWAISIDFDLWMESKQFANQFQIDSAEKLKALTFKMGGGGIYPVLYFLTRLYRPEIVLETGVAAGYSSNTFLTALQRNGQGHLFSSDFPYFRIKNPEKYIGILVETELKKGWNLFIEGDRINLPIICSKIDKVDIFHYDSDKSYSGRDYAFNLIHSKLHKDSVVIFDDIQDNNYFKDFVHKLQCEFKIFVFNGKYVGMVFGIMEKKI
jgi:predicted O-methyltransferase YrrM